MQIFLRNLRQQRQVILAIARRQVSERYAGTMVGFLWEILHPLSMVLIFWFVFGVAFKAKGPDGMPFILYFITGMLPWTFFASVVGNGVNSITSHAHLVKKTRFPTETLPFTYLLSSGVTHLMLFMLTLMVMFAHDWRITWYTLQLPYYFVAMSAMLVGLVWLTSSLYVFNRDVGQIVRIVIDIWFWMTPVVWIFDIVPDRFSWILKLNPMLYIVEGYRNSLLWERSIADNPTGALFFWSGTLLLAALGASIFRHLKPEFTDAM